MTTTSTSSTINAEHIAELADACRETFLCAWDADLANETHEALDNLAESADPDTWPATLDASIELAVYLCSFVESRQPPAQEAYEHIESLCARLEAAAQEDLAPRPASPPTPAPPQEPATPATTEAVLQLDADISVDSEEAATLAPSMPDKSAEPQPADASVAPVAPLARRSVKRAETPQVLYIRSAERELPGLSAALAKRKLAVKPVANAAEAATALSKVMPDALLIDSEQMAMVGEMVSRLETSDRSIRALPSTLILGASLDAPTRLAALRSGADLVIGESNSEAIADEVLQRVQERRESAFRVLIIEDDASQAFYVDSILRHQGVITRVAQTADEGLAALSEFRPDLVLLDLHLADRNGIEIAQMIRQRPDLDFVQIVFLSGDQRPEQRFDAIRLGADDFVTKPIKPRHLIALTETRARRARRLAAGAAHDGADSRAGRISREQLLELIANARQGFGSAAALLQINLRRKPVPGRDAGFVALGRLQNEIASAIAEHHHVGHGVCCHEALGYLLVIEGDDAAALGLKARELHQTLQDRHWTSDPFPQSAGFQLSAVRISATFTTEDHAISALIDLRDSGKHDQNHRLLRLDLPSEGDEDTPEARLVRKLFATKLLRSSAVMRYIPLLPVAGGEGGMYRLVLRFSSQDSDAPLEVGVEQCLAHARRIRSESDVVRTLLHSALQRLMTACINKQSLRLLLRMPMETLRDELLLAWLSAEMSRSDIAPRSLVMEFDASELRPQLAQSTDVLSALANLGFMIAAGSVGDIDSARSLASSPLIHMLTVKAPSSDAAEQARVSNVLPAILSEAAKHDKITLVSGANRAEQLATLWTMRVDYLAGDAICGELDDAVFEFPE